ncbi:hypothetical protein GW17_00003491 [Ensete ventricosum]|uniref:Uncharacterized protein n=1 Tax=Ensete ventricosum TaxID=4639 RepID=A0A444GAG7_ENSVE|nr:hypothetical protein GW17_00003491 [Ensete ventricosum]RZR71073.1 hypothetical protein BHM03_00003288 [Ensete ventricosum]
MKNPWNDMIPLLPLQEFMLLTSVQGKLRASALCFIFYVDSLHATWIIHQVLHKLLRSSICIELMVALTPTIPRVSPPDHHFLRLLRIAEQLVHRPHTSPCMSIEFFELAIPLTSVSFAQLFQSLRNTSHFARFHLLLSAPLALSMCYVFFLACLSSWCLSRRGLAIPLNANHRCLFL